MIKDYVKIGTGFWRMIAACTATAYCGSLLEPASAVSADAQDESLRVGISQEPGTLNPAVATMQVETDAFALLFNGLVRFDDHGKIIADLATRVPSQQNGDISPDGKTLTYHLNPRVKWQDGVPLTSKDVKFTYQAIMNPRTASSSRTGYDRITHIDTPDDHTVRISLNAPFAPAVADLFPNSAHGSILPAHLLRQYADLNRIDFATHPIGSGPYRLEKWDHGSELVFSANHDYFRGAPRIERIVWKILPDDQSKLNVLRTHELDLALNVSPNAYQIMGKFPGMHAETAAATYTREHLVFNCRKDPLDDRRVRLALVNAMDPQAIFRKIYHGYGTLGPTDQNPRSTWSNKGIAYYPYDVKKADSLLDAEGWHRGSDGIRSKHGERLTLTFVTTGANQTRESTAVLLQDQWKQAGVEMNIKYFQPATLFAGAANGGVIRSGNYDVALFSFVPSNPDPDDTNTIGPKKAPPDGNNFSFYSNPEVGRLQERALSTYGTTSREPFYDRIQKIMIKDVPDYTIIWKAEINVAADRLHGIRPAAVGSDFWNVETWSLSPDKKVSATEKTLSMRTTSRQRL
ncbi:MAG TPA: peptide ABC transporter substrate-binding protein [Candidatus Baltobacteraceae bacterium]|jgi:peptide/nickel transport system substrate-binding protein|nr:peptide ABC transporter substrate-binding protein [Candidatus Baltobacteraceae bacterium]